MELIYVELCAQAIVQQLGEVQLAQEFCDTDIPLPYILRSGNSQDSKAEEAATLSNLLGAEPAGFDGQEGVLDWGSIVDGICYIALYQPQHEHSAYYRDFLLRLEPELPQILQEHLREQCDASLWQAARDTVGLLRFLLPQAHWPLLELGYLYEQEAEQALLQHRFAACCECWELAGLAYRQLLERDDLTAKCYYQLGYYYLQCWDLPAAYRAFVSCQQLALAPEHPLWSQCHHWLQQLGFLEDGGPSLSRHLDRVRRGLLGLFSCAQGREGGEGAAPNQDLDEIPAQQELDELLSQHSDCALLWFLRGLFQLYGHLPLPGREGFAAAEARKSFARAGKLGWTSPLAWQLPYYLGLCDYLEGDYHRAERSFLQVLQENPEHAGTLYWLERLYREREDCQSQQYTNVLQALYPDFPELIGDFL